MNSKKILTPELKIAPNEMTWYFIADYYDGPIEGLAMYRGRVVEFCTFPEDVPEHHLYVLHELDEEEIARALKEKAEFEAMVGTHWSYDEKGEPLPRIMRSAELQAEYFGRRENQPMPPREPAEKPVLAWFDVREEPGSLRRAPR